MFKLDKAAGYDLTTLIEFDGDDGAGPQAALIADPAGNFYGTTFFGGADFEGVLFKLDATNGYVLTTLTSFGGAKGRFPQGELIIDSAGNLYGTTLRGGADDFGTVFMLDAANGYSQSTLYEFDGTTGGYPFSGLVADAAGNLYGTTYVGGVLDQGIIYRLEDTGFQPWTVTRGGTLAPGGALTTANPDATAADFATGLPFATAGTPTGVTVASSDIANVRRRPVGVTGDYLSIGFGSITFDFLDALQYFGIYAGSPDEYNFIEFFADSGTDGVPGAAIDIPGLGTVVSGAELANLFGSPLYGSEYWNFSFTALEEVRYVRLSSTNNAFEVGEIAYQYFGSPLVAFQAQVPAPSAVLLLGLSAFGLIAARRR